MRINQWYKNLLLFASITFSHNLSSPHLWSISLLAFFSFCLLSSAGYLVNDVIDRKQDRIHPSKSLRPIAQGKLSVGVALTSAILLTILSLIISWHINLSFLFISLGYLSLSILYSLYFKHLILVDVLVVAIGFVLRAVASCLALNLVVSEWLIVCSFLLALFLVLNKRWREHPEPILDKLISAVTGSLLVSYFVYAILSQNITFLVSIVFVIYGLFRYLYLVQHFNHDSSPEKLLKDEGIMISIGCWIICMVVITL
jgi:4-hydroxybenzoate polyprenyltransferase